MNQRGDDRGRSTSGGGESRRPVDRAGTAFEPAAQEVPRPGETHGRAPFGPRCRTRLGLFLGALALMLGACTSGASTGTSPTGVASRSASSAAAPSPAATPTGAGAHDHGAATAGSGATDDAASGPTPSPYEQLRTATLRVLHEHGSEAALRSLQRRVTRHPELAGYCHPVAHDLGHAALEAAHGDASEAMDARNDVCGGGYIHGVVEAALEKSRHPERDLLRICAPANDGTCWHGVGHGVMFASTYHVTRAEALCSRAPSQRLVARCAEGVYMQLFTTDEGGGTHAAWPGFVEPTSTTAPATCRKAGPAFTGACWFYAPTLLLQEHPEHWKAALRWCGRQRSGTPRNQCTAGVGSRLVKYHPEDVPFAARQCRAAPAGERGACLAGMGSYWRVHWAGARTRASVCDHLKAPDLVGECRAVNA